MDEHFPHHMPVAICPLVAAAGCRRINPFYAGVPLTTALRLSRAKTIAQQP